MWLWQIAVPLFVLSVLWVVIFFHTGEGYYALDPKDGGSGNTRGRGTFEPHNKNYMELAKLVIGLGSGSIAALTLFFFRTDSTLHGVQSFIAWPLVCFAATVVFGVIFIGLLVWRYEKYCHDSNSYTRMWYVSIVALGFSMLACLALGYAIFVGILVNILQT